MPIHRSIASVSNERVGWWQLLPIPLIVAITAGLFLLAPWSLETKAFAALHGLCAQRPSHSFVFGDRTLPFDARMTGIYAGFLVSMLYLTQCGRLSGAKLPSLPIMVAFGLFVTAMAVDGANSLLLDLLMWHPYEPNNGLRLGTGLLAGISLAVVIAYLLATTLWKERSNNPAIVTSWGEIAALVVLQVPVIGIVLSERTWFYVPITLLLLSAAVLVLASLAFVSVVLVEYGDGAFTRSAEMQRPAVIALVIALTVMGTIAAGRFLLERVLGLPTMM